MVGGKDRLFAAQRPDIADFKFDESVSGVFPDMIRRSVPGYETITALTGIIAEKYARPDTRVYDLGCSLGALMLSMYARIDDDSVRFVGVDNSRAMLHQCGENLHGVIPPGQIELIAGNVEEVDVRNASVVVMNFTLQFIDTAFRAHLIQQIFNGLRPHGAFILSEKISFADAAESRLQQRLHEQFKLSNGYSALEISQKRSALEKVMILDDANTHLHRLHSAGFHCAVQWFQSFNFASFVGIK